jgi:hypothetical protein
MIKNYIPKMWFMWRRQKGLCSGCGKPIDLYYDQNRREFHDGITEEKVDFAHNFANTKKHVKNYPLFIHSMFNGSVQTNSCNVARRPPWWLNGIEEREKPINDYQASEWEKKLQNDESLRLMGECEGLR